MCPESIGPVSGQHTNNPYASGMLSKGEIAPGKPLPPDDPWCKSLHKLFPNLPMNIIQEYAAAFRDNMFNALNNEVNRCKKQQKAAADKFRKAIEGDD